MFLWETPDNYPERLIGTYDRSTSPNRFLFRQGCPLPPLDSCPTVHFDCAARDIGSFDDLANSAMIPLVSERIQTILMTHAGADVEFVDIRIITRNGELSGYRLLNATNCVKAINHSASKYSLIPGTTSIMGFRELAVLPHALGTHALAREAEYKSHLLVSDVLAERLLALKPRQFGLFRPEDMRW